MGIASRLAGHIMIRIGSLWKGHMKQVSVKPLEAEHILGMLTLSSHSDTT
jgi:hypothetical protein